MNDQQAAAPAGEPATNTKRNQFVVWGTRILAVIGALAIVGGVIAGAVAVVLANKVENALGLNPEHNAEVQQSLQPFYTPPATIPPEPGTIIRSEPMSNVQLDNGTAQRILYTSQDSTGKPVAVSGMVFIPNTPPPAGGTRKIVAWAHPTVGLADQCAPSRSVQPLADTGGWLGQMLDQGWVVTATDYYGLGTPGPKTYLIGQQEARDVVNSVRAVRNLSDAAAGKEWIVWGHSQGGHSALWTAALADKLAPELPLLATGAAAPAQQLTTIIEQQWNQIVGWVIGVEAVVSFQDYYQQFQLMDSVTQAGKDHLQLLNEECVVPDGIRSAVLEKRDGPFFTEDPLNNPQWVMIAEQQTPPRPAKKMPVFMSEGTSDNVVGATTNANMQVEWCKAGVNLTVEWLGEVGHLAVANASGPAFVQWAADRFAGKAASPDCSFPTPVKPAPKPTIDPQVQQQADQLLAQYPLPPVR